MASNNIYYDTTKMKNAAASIRTEVGKYKTSRTEIDSTVEGMRTYWEDEVNQNYVRKYNNDLAPTAQSVEKLMEAFANFLEEAAKAVEDSRNAGNAGLNG